MLSHISISYETHQHPQESLDSNLQVPLRHDNGPCKITIRAHSYRQPHLPSIRGSQGQPLLEAGCLGCMTAQINTGKSCIQSKLHFLVPHILTANSCQGLSKPPPVLLAKAYDSPFHAPELLPFSFAWPQNSASLSPTSLYDPLLLPIAIKTPCPHSSLPSTYPCHSDPSLPAPQPRVGIPICWHNPLPFPSSA